MPAPSPLVTPGFPQRPPNDVIYGPGFGGNRSVQNFAAPGGGGGNLTLDALMMRQKQAMAAQQQNMSEGSNGTILGGLGQMTGTFFNALQQRRAEKEEGQAWGEISEAMRQVDPVTGLPSPDTIAAIMRRSPEIGMQLYETAMKARQDAASQEHWSPIDTPEGENGQWFRNQAGDTKKVGGGSPGEGGWKPSDIGSLRDDYTKAAGTYENAAPAWASMQNAARTAIGKQGPEVGAADYDMVVGLAKILDPTSVVREGEVDTIRSTGGAADYLISYVNKLAGGGSLTDDIRRGIMATGSSRMKAHYQQAKEKRDWISGIATRHEIDPNDVVPPLAGFQDWVEGGAEPPPVDPNDAANDDAAYPG
jgi:hypothetical protein